MKTLRHLWQRLFSIKGESKRTVVQVRYHFHLPEIRNFHLLPFAASRHFLPVMIDRNFKKHTFGLSSRLR